MFRRTASTSLVSKYLPQPDLPQPGNLGSAAGPGIHMVRRPRSDHAGSLYAAGDSPGPGHTLPAHTPPRPGRQRRGTPMRHYGDNYPPSETIIHTPLGVELSASLGDVRSSPKVAVNSVSPDWF